jgi:hypothetical protein
MLLRITARWSRGGKSLHDPRSNHGPVILSISSARQPAGMVLAAAARIDQDDIDQHHSARFSAKTAYSSPSGPRYRASPFRQCSIAVASLGPHQFHRMRSPSPGIALSHCGRLWPVVFYSSSRPAPLTYVIVLTQGDVNIRPCGFRIETAASTGAGGWEQYQHQIPRPARHKACGFFCAVQKAMAGKPCASSVHGP